MKGLELSRSFFREYGEPMLRESFPELMQYIAAGFVGRGSDRYGFDDEVSRDHDFEPGFCIFLPGEDIVDRRAEFLLERAYAHLPKEYLGVERQRMSPVGGNRNGVIRTSRFYEEAVGAPDGELSLNAWLHIPDYALAEAVNGEVYFDGYGEFSEIRNRIIDMPQDVRLKRLAGNLLIMAQSGQYNYMRCCSHGEYEAAQLACGEFVGAALKALFNLRKSYMPYYKWSFRALRQLPDTERYCELLSSLLAGDSRCEDIAVKKLECIEEVCERVSSELRNLSLSPVPGSDMEKHAYAVNDSVEDGIIRNMHILISV